MREHDLLRIEEAFRVAESWSSDPDTQTGVVLLQGDYTTIVWAANSTPCNVTVSKEMLVRPEKYKWVMHAERKAIGQAARRGIKTYGLACVQTAPPCADCAQVLVEAGISIVIYPADHAFVGREDWAKSIQDGEDILRAGGVKIRKVER